MTLFAHSCNADIDTEAPGHAATSSNTVDTRLGSNPASVVEPLTVCVFPEPEALRSGIGGRGGGGRGGGGGGGREWFGGAGHAPRVWQQTYPKENNVARPPAAAVVAKART